MPTEADQDSLAIELRIAVMRTSRRLRIEGTGDVITPGQYSILNHLRTGRRTLSELAQLENVQAPSITRIVNALTELNFAQRSANPEDRRQFHVMITPAGEAALEEARVHRTAWLAQRVAGMSQEDRKILSRAAQIMQEMSAK